MRRALAGGIMPVGEGEADAGCVMPTVSERLHEALNRHDLEAFLECFDQDYRSEQPVHPNRGFGGKEQGAYHYKMGRPRDPHYDALKLRLEIAHAAAEAAVVEARRRVRLNDGR